MHAGDGAGEEGAADARAPAVRLHGGDQRPRHVERQDDVPDVVVAAEAAQQQHRVDAADHRGEEAAQHAAEAAADGEGGQDAEQAGEHRHQVGAGGEREVRIQPGGDALHGGDGGDVQRVRGGDGEAERRHRQGIAAGAVGDCVAGRAVVEQIARGAQPGVAVEIAEVDPTSAARVSIVVGVVEPRRLRRQQARVLVRMGGDPVVDGADARVGGSIGRWRGKTRRHLLAHRGGGELGQQW